MSACLSHLVCESRNCTVTASVIGRMSRIQVEALYWDDKEAIVSSDSPPPTYVHCSLLCTPAVDDDKRICPNMAQLAQYRYHTTAVGHAEACSSGATLSGIGAAPHPTPSLGLPAFPGSRPSPSQSVRRPFLDSGHFDVLMPSRLDPVFCHHLALLPCHPRAWMTRGRRDSPSHCT